MIKHGFVDHHYHSIKDDKGAELFSIEELSEYAKNLLNLKIDKDDHCEKTYVKPRLQRVPDKLKFLDDLIDAYEIRVKNLTNCFEKWNEGDYYFLTSDAQFDFTITDEGQKITEKERWYENYLGALQMIDRDDLVEFLNELRYLIYLKNEKKELLTIELETTDIMSTNAGKARAFLVHGRDEEVKHTVARFLSDLEISTVILAEQGGIKSILDKFEGCSDVDFAVILLTPDDLGHLVGEEPKPRARQNVIFEMGYFIAKLKKEKVFVLVKGEPDKPSDYSGIIYLPYDDAGGWKLLLAKEIKTIGINIDLNKAI